MMQRALFGCAFLFFTSLVVGAGSSAVTADGFICLGDQDDCGAISRDAGDCETERGPLYLSPLYSTSCPQYPYGNNRTLRVEAWGCTISGEIPDDVELGYSDSREGDYTWVDMELQPQCSVADDAWTLEMCFSQSPGSLPTWFKVQAVGQGGLEDFMVQWCCGCE